MPPDHPLRQRLNDEVHARPPERPPSPSRVSFLALVADGEARRAAWDMIRARAERSGVAPPEIVSRHLAGSISGTSLR